MNFGRYDRIVGYYATQWPLLVPGYLPILSAMPDLVGVASFRPRSILDLGCGPGSASSAVAAACDATSVVTLVDGSAAMLQAARTTLANVREAVHGDFTDSAVAEHVFNPGAYDLCLCSFALHHLEDSHKRVTLERASRALRPGGLLLLADEVVSDRPAGWDVVERVRSRVIGAHLQAGRIAKEFWDLETSLPPDLHLPFLPSRTEDLTSFLARVGFATSMPVSILGSALFVAVKTS
jgi:tRNA (cmo5U34)-methyltransferase